MNGDGNERFRSMPRLAIPPMTSHGRTDRALPFTRTSPIGSYVATPAAMDRGHLAHDHASRRRCRLQARRRVHGVARQEAHAGGRVDVQADERVPGVDARPRHQPAVVLAVHVGQPLLQADRCTHGPLGIVLVCSGYAEHPDHGVAHELLHDAAVLLDYLTRQRVELPEQAIDVLRIGLLRERREAHEVAEESRDDAALGGVSTAGAGGPCRNVPQ